MRTIITVEEMHAINQILEKRISPSQFTQQSTITIPEELDFWNKPRTNPPLDKSNQFVHDLFVYYKTNKLASYKQIFDFTFEKGIDLLTCFNNVCLKGLAGDPDLCDLFLYAYNQQYCAPNHDFSVYINVLSQPTKANILEQIKLLPALDDSKSSFGAFCKLFEHYLVVNPYPSYSEQENIAQLFKKFAPQDFYQELCLSHQKFYPSLLKADNFSQLQEDDYFSKRFCFSADHSVSTLAQNINNSLHFIYNVVFEDLKEKEQIADFHSFSEQGSFYLYIFTQDAPALQLLGKAIHSFHQQIQPFLQNNTEEDTYYNKLFQTVCLAEKLASKERNNEPTLPGTHFQRKKI